MKTIIISLLSVFLMAGLLFQTACDRNSKEEGGFSLSDNSNRGFEDSKGGPGVPSKAETIKRIPFKNDNERTHQYRHETEYPESK